MQSPSTEVQVHKSKSRSPENQGFCVSGLAFLDFWTFLSGLTARRPRVHSGFVLSPISARAQTKGKIWVRFGLSSRPHADHGRPSAESPRNAGPRPESPSLASPSSDVQIQVAEIRIQEIQVVLDVVQLSSQFLHFDLRVLILRSQPTREVHPPFLMPSDILWNR